MGWEFAFFSDTNSEIVITDLQNKLRLLNTYEAVRAKIGHSDLSEGRSRGAVLFLKGAGELPPYDLKGSFQYKYVETEANDDNRYKELLTQLCKQLDDLSEAEAAYAKFSVSSYKEGTCQMVLFWREATPKQVSATVSSNNSAVNAEVSVPNEQSSRVGVTLPVGASKGLFHK